MTALTDEEKASVIEIIEIIYGRDSSLASLKSNVNQRTVAALEETLTLLEKCNGDMKNLIVNLIGGTAHASSGWLKRSLKALNRALKNDQIRFDGLACRSVVGGSRKTIIYGTLYY